MFRELHFPTPVYIADIEHPTLNQELERDIVAWSNKDKGVVRTNVQGWHSTTDMHEKPEYKKLVDMLYACQKTIYDQEHLDSEPVLGNMWANINPPGGMNRAHQHPNSLWSGVYYIKAPKNSGHLKIDDPRSVACMSRPRQKEGKVPERLFRETHYEPIAGRCIMFPSWLMHCVDPNQSNDIRISVSFNFFTKVYGSMSFQTNKYQVIKNAVSYDLANFILNYFLLKRDAVGYMYEHNIHSQSPILGTWSDQQIPNTYSCYADFAMETLMVKMLPVMKQHTGLDLCPTYSYARAYKKGDELRRHKDRPSCEISTTVNLGGDPWPIFIDGTGANNVIDEYKNIHKPNAPAGTKVLLEVGDMLVYSGCELEHWREPFDGNICGQVFLHYNHVNGPFADKNRFDGRAKLGLPSGVK